MFREASRFKRLSGRRVTRCESHGNLPAARPLRAGGGFTDCETQGTSGLARS